MSTPKIKVVELHYESRLCPMTLVGKTDQGHTIYVRVRWSHLSIRIDPRENPPLGGAEGTWIYSEKIDDGEYTAWLDYDTLRQLTAELIEWPENEPSDTLRPHNADAIEWPENEPP